MNDQTYESPKILVENLSGLDERRREGNENLGRASYLQGLVAFEENELSRPNGIKPLLRIEGQEIVGLFQTFNSRNHVYVQTRENVYVMTTNELFGYTEGTSLTYVGLTEEEDMSIAVLTHAEATTVNAGNITTSWAQRVLNNIANQTNPDGTAASFCSLAANRFTLDPGKYRVNGWAAVYNSTAVLRTLGLRLYNVTASAAAWAGLDNECSFSRILSATANEQLFIWGYLDLAVPTQFELQSIGSVAVTNGLGIASNLGPRELYATLQILKTA